MLRPPMLFYVVLALLALPGILCAASPRNAGRPMKLEDLFRFQRVSDPQVSPDGMSVAYVVTTVDLEGNRSSSSIFLAPAVGRGEPRRLTNSPGKKDRHPRWSPDGEKVLFESNRSGTMQLWVIDVGGGEARQLTDISTGAESAQWSPDGNSIAFLSSVYPEFSDKPFKESDAANKKKLEEVEKSPVKARVATKLFWRHWDSYVEDRRQHLFVIPFTTDKSTDPRDLTPGDRDAAPTSDTFSIGDDFTWSPDGQYLLFTAPPAEDESWSTNYEICRVAAKGGKVETLTEANKAADTGPRFSPDGKKLAYRAQSRPGFEADRWQLMVVDCDASGGFKGKPRSVSADFDGSPEVPVWSADGKSLFFTADAEARQPIFQIALEGGPAKKIAEGGSNSSLSLSKDGKVLAFTQAALAHPAEVYAISGPGHKDITPVRNLSRANAKLLAELDLPTPESVTVKGAGGTPMQMWILKPPGFDAKKKWPVAFLVHGGPQGAWEDGWSFRWCPELWAAQGYVVALPNPRGSTGFGQKYVDEISGDWGGKCYQDLMRGVDYLETLPYVDKERIGSAGASFGGYMMDWFAVNTDRFKCLITHCSVWNFESMYATTDELWFDEWEHGGPPWGPNRKAYEKHSPHRLAANLGKFKTPMLVIHNDNDFRCPIGQGIELFTSLQRQKVPSKLVNFPDEGHWVLKPKNSEFWHKEVFTWLTKYVPPGGK
jgi:dipeptidyl aminopeptidase/acylaminoacyl peptidase